MFWYLSFRLEVKIYYSNKAHCKHRSLSNLTGTAGRVRWFQGTGTKVWCQARFRTFVVGMLAVVKKRYDCSPRGITGPHSVENFKVYNFSNTAIPDGIFCSYVIVTLSGIWVIEILYRKGMDCDLLEVLICTNCPLAKPCSHFAGAVTLGMLIYYTLDI